MVKGESIPFTFNLSPFTFYYRKQKDYPVRKELIGGLVGVMIGFMISIMVLWFVLLWKDHWKMLSMAF